MCSFVIPHKLYGIHMDAAIAIATRSYFVEFIEILPHIKKYTKDNKSVWYIFEYSGFIRVIFEKFLEKQIGNKVRNYPWIPRLISTYHNGPLIRKDHKKPVYNECTYVPYSIFPNRRTDDAVTLTTQQLYNLIN